MRKSFRASCRGYQRKAPAQVRGRGRDLLGIVALHDDASRDDQTPDDSLLVDLDGLVGCQGFFVPDVLLSSDAKGALAPFLIAPAAVKVAIGLVGNIDEVGGLNGLLHGLLLRLPKGIDEGRWKSCLVDVCHARC